MHRKIKNKITVKNSEYSEWNGEYFEAKVQYNDKGTISYVKDNKYHIYSHNGLWRLAI